MSTVAPRPADNASAEAIDAWPRTQRMLPWLVAMFLTAVCLVPIDSITLNVGFPVDPKLDRLLLIVVAFVWMLAYWAGGHGGPELPRLGAVGLGVWAWVATSYLSVLVMLPTLIMEDAVTLAGKRLILMLAFVVFFLIVVSVVRRTEVRAFVSYWLGLTAVLAIGAVYSYVTRTEPFREICNSILPGIFSIQDYQVVSIGGISVVGPTAHGLALTTMLVLPMPFIINRILDDERRSRKYGYGLLLVLCAVGSMTTGRKSHIVVPLGIGLVMLLYRPREIVKLAPALVAFVPVVQIVTPGAFSSILYRANSNNAAAAQSTKDRVDDWSGVAPDLIAHPWLGKGYGSGDVGTYRVLDNQWLGTLVETGAIGTLALAALLISCWWLCHRTARAASDSETRGLAVGGAAAVVAFAVSMALYDAFAFVQSFYLLLFIMALVTVLGGERSGKAQLVGRQ